MQSKKELIKLEISSINYCLKKNKHSACGLLYDYSTYGDITTHLLRIEQLINEIQD